MEENTDLIALEPIEQQRDSKGRLLPGNTLGRRWVKGESGNPKGSEPKESCLTALYREELARTNGKDKRTKEQIIADKAIEHLTTQEIDSTWLRLLELVQERTEGKVTLPIDGDIHTFLTVRHDR